MNSKEFVAKCFMDNTKRYGTDAGDLNIVNDYLASRGWDILTREQLRAVTTMIRLRNMFLADNPSHDLRKKHTPPLFVQLSIYDYLDNDTAKQTKKLANYFTGDESRLQQTNARVKNSVRGVDNEHITAAKIMLPLFVSQPTLKKMKINKDKESTKESTKDTGFDDNLGEKTKTNTHKGKAGE